MHHLMRIKCHINDTVSCTLKGIWIWIWHIIDDIKVKQCNESNKEIWWDILSYWYDEDYAKDVKKEDNELTIWALSCFFVIDRLLWDYLS